MIQYACRPQTITTPRQLLTDVKEKNEPRKRQGLFMRSVALTAKPPASERLVETSQQD